MGRSGSGGTAVEDFCVDSGKKQKEADLGLAGGQEDIEYCRGMNENDVDDDDYYEVKTLMMMSSVRSEGAWCDWQQGGLATIC